MEILQKNQAPCFDTYLLRIKKNNLVFSEIVTATHYRISGDIIISPSYKRKNSIRIHAGNDPVAAIENELT